jgi:hypothetical protein
MSSKLRSKLLEKIAQATPVETGPATVPGSPSKCDVVSYFGSVIKGWQNQNVSFIQEIIDDLNESIYVLSQGQIDFNKLRVQSFNVDAGKYPDRILKNIVKFSQQVYSLLLTDQGKDFAAPLTPETRELKINQLTSNLGTVGIPDGSINQFLFSKIGGNLKTKLMTNLKNIK